MSRKVTVPTKPPRKVTKPLPATVEDPFDTTPTPAIPGVFIGVYKGVQRRCALAYRRDNRHVWTIMFSENGGARTLVRWSVDNFDTNMRPAPVPIGVTDHRYPIHRAVRIFLQPGAVYEDAAYRVLIKLSKGQDPMAEDTIDDLLDMTPSEVKPRARRNRTLSDKLARRAKRKAKLAALSPAELRAFRDRRNARRRMRRANEGKGAKK